MALTINTNIASLTAQRNLVGSQSMLSSSLERLSSGLRINSAKDDAAGLAISERFTAQVRGLNQGVRNANDGISLVQTAEGALTEVTSNLQRIRELAVQASNATNSSADRDALQNEVAQLVSEIDRVAASANFNNVNLLDGSFTSKIFQVGADTGQNVTVDSIASSRSSSLGQFQGFTLSDQGIGTASDTAGAQSVTVGGTTTSLGSIANDAKALATAFNAAGIGANVTANATFQAGQDYAQVGSATDVSTLTLNGIAITLTNSGVQATNQQHAADQINAVSAATGVTATVNGAAVDLTANDGRNITIAYTHGGTNDESDFGLAVADTYGATLNFSYVAPSGTTGTFEFTGAFDPGDQTIAATGTALSAISVSTYNGAQTAITSLDAALSTVNSTRATLGAYQNRFESVVASQSATAENLSASRSRIMDADFASETAQLTKAQILQQSGIAMLAQANSIPQNVLALLQ